LAGVSEVAEMLGVSKQRVSELAKTRGFPKPLVTLASGPVWPVAAIRSFARSWIRRPGPKPVVVTTGAGVKAAVAAGKVARAATAAKERAVPPKARVKA
jgi:predicted DNA-binding transcriptional regulator AlpA